jgi:hypothetical protein
MSELKERVEEALKALINDTVDDKKTYDGVAEIQAGELGDLPGLGGMLDFSMKDAVKLLRRVYREHSGIDYTSYDQLSEAVFGEAVSMVATCTCTALSSGLHVGARIGYQTKRHLDQDRANEMFSHKGWRQEVFAHSLMLSEDDDLVDFLKFFVAHNYVFMSRGSGLDQDPDPEKTNKVWDVWYLAARSAIVSLYGVGVRLGREDLEKETLEGILSATETVEKEE